MKKKKIILIFVSVLVVLLVVGVILGNVFNKNNDETPTDQVENNVNYSFNNVYLVDNDNVLVPLSIKYETFDSVGEELMYLVTMLKENSSISTNTFKGLLPKDCFVKSLDLNDGIVKVNFDSNFVNYEGKNELKLLESLVWTLCDYKDVMGVSLIIEDKEVKNMPVNNTPVDKVITKQIGINNFLLTSSIMGKGERVLSYYEKKIQDKYYYVPVTHYVSNNLDLSIYDLTINTLFKDPGLTSNLQICRIFEKTKMVSTSLLTDNILYLSLTEDILFDETTVSLDVYNVLVKVVSLLTDVNDVSFLMELEEVMVNGKNSEENQVSKIELNKYYI